MYAFRSVELSNERTNISEKWHLMSNLSRNLVIGLVIAILIGYVGRYLATIIPNVGSVTLAIIIGIFVSNFIPSLQQYDSGFKFAEKRILPLAIVFLGAELQLQTLASLGLPAAVIIVSSVTTSVLVSMMLGNFFGFSRKFSTLMGAGNGICGSSAIAATSASINANESDVGISISVVNLLGTIGIFLVPLFARLLAFNDTQSGILIGGTLQAVGQVVAAGFTFSEDAGSIAIVVKMGRILMLAPMVVLFRQWMQEPKEKNDKTSKQFPIPLFIIGFFVISILVSTGLLGGALIANIKSVGKLLLVVAMAGIGLRIRLNILLTQGPKALVFGALVMVAQIAVLTPIISILFGDIL